MEIQVCGPHLADLQRGEPYRIDEEANELLIGVAIDLADQRMLTRWRGFQNDGGPGLSVRFEDETGVERVLYFERRELERFVVEFADLYVSPERIAEIRAREGRPD